MCSSCTPPQRDQTAGYVGANSCKLTLLCVRAQIPLWVKRMGGMAVVKVPYANAGQGVWTIVNDEELAAFMLIPHHYSAFIVQARHPCIVTL